MNYNDIEPNLVRVNQGSGVLVPALSDEFCYVFTAKHNLNPNENIIKDRDGNEVARATSRNCYVDQTRDAAVIVLPGVDCAPLSLDCESLGRTQKITLGGYPATRPDAVGAHATRFFEALCRFEWNLTAGAIAFNPLITRGGGTQRVLRQMF